MKKEKTNDTQASEENVAVATEAPEKKEVKESKPAKVTKVGALLKEMRLQKGLKTPDIAKKLCIRKCYLDAIEESNYKEIPVFPYGIGFIRSYANFLGLNGENIVELYKEETNTSEPKDMHVLEPQPEASMPGWQYLLISLLAIAAIYAGWRMYSKTETSTSEESIVTAKEEVKADESGVVVVEDFNFGLQDNENSGSEKENNADNNNEDQQINVSNENYVEPQTGVKAENVKSETTQDADDKVKDVIVGKTEVSTDNKIETKPSEKKTSITEKVQPVKQGVFLEILKETWIEVKDEHKLYISKVLQAGDSYTVPEGKGMILSVGKVDGVNVYINGVLTKVARVGKKTNISLDKFLADQH